MSTPFQKFLLRFCVDMLNQSLYNLCIGGDFVIGDRIKAIRKEKNLSQTAFGNVLGVSRDVVNNAENNRAEVSELMIRAIVSNFNVSEVWLRSGEGTMFVSLGRMAEITRRVAQMAGEDNPFKEKLILALLRIPPEKWHLIEKAAREILAENEKDPDD